MSARFRAAVTAALIVSAGFMTAPAAAQAGPCCIVRGERWFTGPTQAADCEAAGQALLRSWDAYNCTPVGDRTHLTYWRIIS